MPYKEEDSKEYLRRLMDDIKASKWKFEMAVEATSLEVTEIAKDISKAIGEISVAEAKEVIIREFAERLRK